MKTAPARRQHSVGGGGGGAPISYDRRRRRQQNVGGGGAAAAAAAHSSMTVSIISTRTLIKKGLVSGTGNRHPIPTDRVPAVSYQ